MAATIYLAPMPLGRPKPYHIKKAHSTYIDENYPYLTPETMAKMLNIHSVTVHAYCSEKKYKTVQTDRKIPSKKKEELFDFDKHMKDFVF